MAKTAKSTQVVFVNKFPDSSLIGMVPRDTVNEYWWIAYLWNDALFIKKGSHGKCNARSYISQRIRSTREEDWPELKIWVFTSFCSLAAFPLLGYEVKANRGNGLTFIKPRPPSVPIQVGLANQALDWSQIFRSTKHTYCQVFIVFSFVIVIVFLHFYTLAHLAHLVEFHVWVFEDPPHNCLRRSQHHWECPSYPDQYSKYAIVRFFLRRC